MAKILFEFKSVLLFLVKKKYLKKNKGVVLLSCNIF